MTASIRNQLEQVKTPRKNKLIQFNISIQQDRILGLITNYWKVQGGKSELIRRCLNHTFSRIKDRELLKLIQDIKDEG